MYDNISSFIKILNNNSILLLEIHTKNVLKHAD